MLRSGKIPKWKGWLEATHETGDEDEVSLSKQLIPSIGFALENALALGIQALDCRSGRLAVRAHGKKDARRPGERLDGERKGEVSRSQCASGIIGFPGPRLMDSFSSFSTIFTSPKRWFE